MHSEVNTVQVGGLTWYCSSAEIKSYILGITDKDKQAEAITQLATGSNPLISLDENTFVDTSQMVDDEGQAATLNTNFASINKLSANSNADEFLSAYNELESASKELDSAIDALNNCESIEDIKSVFSQIANIESGITSLNSTMESVGGAKKGSGAGTALGITAGTVGTLAGGIGVAGALLLGTNPIGWGVLATAGLITGIASIGNAMKTSNQNAMAKDLEEIKTKLETLQSDMQEKREIASENIQEAMGGILENITSNLGGVLNDDGTANYSGVSAQDILTNITNIQTAQSEMQEYLTVCNEYGISVPELEEVIKILSGDNGTGFVQSYLDGYAETVKASATGELIGDTQAISATYNEIDALITEAKAKGLNTSALEAARDALATTNQGQVDTAAGNYTSGYGAGGTGDLAGDVGNMMDGANAADNQANGLSGVDTSYNLQTDVLQKAAQDLRTASQEQIEEYAAGIDPSAMESLDALDALYQYVNANLTALEQAGTRLNTTSLTQKLNEINAEKQKIVDSKQSEFETLLDMATTKEEASNVEKKIAEYVEMHVGREGVDLSGLVALKLAASAKKDELDPNKTNDTGNNSNNDNGGVSNGGTNTGGTVIDEATQRANQEQSYNNSVTAQMENLNALLNVLSDFENEIIGKIASSGGKLTLEEREGYLKQLTGITNRYDQVKGGIESLKNAIQTDGFGIDTGSLSSTCTQVESRISEVKDKIKSAK